MKARRSESGKRCDNGNGGWSDTRPRAKGRGQPLEVRKGKETDSPLEPPERMKP